MAGTNLLINYFYENPVLGITIDKCEELNRLFSRASEMKEYSFEEKINKITSLVSEALPKNAVSEISDTNLSYEEEPICSPQDKFYHSIITDTQIPFSSILEKQTAACRHYAALFFMLGAFARMGTEHTVEMSEFLGFSHLFNVVTAPDGTKHTIDLFQVNENKGKVSQEFYVEAHKNPKEEEEDVYYKTWYKPVPPDSKAIDVNLGVPKIDF